MGLVREVNEDAHVAAPPVFAVADGMGGHAGGDIASAIVVEELGRLAGPDVRRRGGRARRSSTPCTRASAGSRSTPPAGSAGPRRARRSPPPCCVDASRWLVVNLGDSRVYRVTGGRLVQVSRDHSLVQDLVDAGDITEAEVADHPERHVITRALGGPGFTEPDLFWVDARRRGPAARCARTASTAQSTTRRSAGMLAAEPDPSGAAAALVAAALDAGGEDNATAWSSMWWDDRVSRL